MSEAKRASQAPAERNHMAEALRAGRLLDWQQKQQAQSPDPKNQSADAPRNRSPTAVSRDDRTKNRVETVNQCYGSVERSRFHVRLDKEKAGEIAEEMIEIHQ
jgi:hypothetical protein